MTTPEEATENASAANVLGTEIALTAALRALIKAHPHPTLLADELCSSDSFRKHTLKRARSPRKHYKGSS